MKHLKRIVVLCIIASTIFCTSCGKDEDEELNLSDVQFTFDPESPPINQTIITNLFNSQDDNAVEIGSNLSLANLMTLWLAFFEQPEGAVQSNVPVGTCGGNNTLVYTYTASTGTETISISYQICETVDKYIFQIFISQNGGNFVKFIEAEESKAELKQGLMKLYASDPEDMEVSTDPVLIYSWDEEVDGTFTYTVSDSSDEYFLMIEVNADNSGSLSITEGGSLVYEATWNSTGTAGTYKIYSGGVLTDEGNWPA